jgi:hypothetical protein
MLVEFRDVNVQRCRMCDARIESAKICFNDRRRFLAEALAQRAAQSVQRQSEDRGQQSERDDVLARRRARILRQLRERNADECRARRSQHFGRRVVRLVQHEAAILQHDLAAEPREIREAKHDQRIDRIGLREQRRGADADRARRFPAADLRPVRFRLDHVQAAACARHCDEIAGHHRAVSAGANDGKSDFVFHVITFAQGANAQRCGASPGRVTVITRRWSRRIDHR